MYFQSCHPLHKKLGMVKTLFHRAGNLDDMLSEQKHLRQCLNQCDYWNSIIDHVINFNNVIIPNQPHQYRKINAVYLPYYDELSEKMKGIFQDYYMSTQIAAVNTLMNSLVHPKDKQQQSRQSDDVYEICYRSNCACQDAYIGETSQPLQYPLNQHSRSSYNGNDSAVFKHTIASGHQIDVNDVTILDRDKNWFERGGKEAEWVRSKNILQ